MTSLGSSRRARLESLLGSARVVADPAALTPYAVDGRLPAATVFAESAEDVAAVIRFAAAEKLAVIPTGGRSKLHVGAPPRNYDIALDMTRMNRVLAYDPGDLTLGVEAGVRFADLTRVLAEKSQFLPLAPAFAAAATIGGLVATNSPSPLRYAYGSARDFLLGIEFVTGEGTSAKSGGRVVKNVTGYDLHKLLIGSLGTLAVMTRVNFKTFPLPPAQQTFVSAFAGAEPALDYCRVIRQSPLEPRLVEAFDPGAARIVDAPAQFLPLTRWCVVVAAGGKPAVVERHARDLRRLSEESKAVSFAVLDESEKTLLLDNVREFVPLARPAAAESVVLRASVLPEQAGTLLRRLREVSERNGFGSASALRAMSLVYHVLLPARGISGLPQVAQTAQALFEVCSDAGASAVLESCSAALKDQVSIWGPPRADWPLMQRVKQVFDPQGVLSPGRFAGGI